MFNNISEKLLEILLFWISLKTLDWLCPRLWIGTKFLAKTGWQLIKNHRPRIGTALQIILGFVPAYALVYGWIVPSAWKSGEFPPIMIYYWVFIYTVYTIGGTIGAIVDKDASPFSPFITSLIVTFFCIAFCFTAGYVVFPLLFIGAINDLISYKKELDLNQNSWIPTLGYHYRK